MVLCRRHFLPAVFSLPTAPRKLQDSQGSYRTLRLLLEIKLRMRRSKPYLWILLASDEGLVLAMPRQSRQMIWPAPRHVRKQ